MNCRIRNATLNDIPFIGWTMWEASRGHLPRGVWDVMCARDARACLKWLERMAAAGDAHAWTHYSNFIIAEVEGRAAAALEGFNPDTTNNQALTAAINQATLEMGWGEKEIVAIYERFVPLMPCMHEYEPGAWIVEHVATHPDFRRRGLTNALLEAIFKRGLAQHRRIAQLSVFIGNTPAITAYEKQGFKITAEKRTLEFAAIVGCPGMYKMTRAL
jgi:ribosomal protein S18 acetylase RimI-like enzyme